MHYRCQFQAGVYIAKDPVCTSLARVTFTIVGMNGCSLYEEGVEMGEEIGEEFRMVVFNVRDEVLVKNVKEVRLALASSSIERVKGFHSARFTDAFFRIIP
eukprot:TRINITY_DN2472_c0_g3_i4.p2 TRINITY_DN2472_c0_g3~~TRINITY_DN2472_c0_g3_i4.p2  ORF type:complete len:101 (+),score=27.84 TRINITY_DN2472_c0_g3_i4:165-467(+)